MKEKRRRKGLESGASARILGLQGTEPHDKFPSVESISCATPNQLFHYGPRYLEP